MDGKTRRGGALWAEPDASPDQTIQSGRCLDAPQMKIRLHLLTNLTPAYMNNSTCLVELNMYWTFKDLIRWDNCTTWCLLLEGQLKGSETSVRNTWVHEWITHTHTHTHTLSLSWFVQTWWFIKDPNKWLILLVRHWIIHSTDSFKHDDSLKNQTSDWLY